MGSVIVRDDIGTRAGHKVTSMVAASVLAWLMQRKVLGEFALVCVKVGHGDMPYLFENLPAHYSLLAMLSAALAL